MNTVADQYLSHNWQNRLEHRPSVFGATFKITLGQHDVYNVWVQVREHLLHALNDSLFHGAGQWSAGWKVFRHSAVKLTGSSLTCVVIEAFRRPTGSSGWALIGFLFARHSLVQM